MAKDVGLWNVSKNKLQSAQTEFDFKEKVTVTGKITNKFGLRFNSIVGFCFLLVGC